MRGEWVTNKLYKDKQSQFVPVDGEVLGGHRTENSKIYTLKTLCNVILKRHFSRTNFPANKEFLEENWRVDSFQDAALFCTVPKTAEQYIKESMHGEIVDSIPKNQGWENDYCYIKGKGVDYYRNIKTTDAMEGKGF